MDFIFTTATVAEKLNRLAKTRRKDSGISLALAQNAIAREHGYAHWKHVTVCRDQTSQRTHSVAALNLPRHLLELLDSAAARSPASSASLEAFTHGLAFAMDVKDADQAARMPYCLECSDAWHIAARDLWRSLVHDKSLADGGSLFETLSPGDLAAFAQDDLSNYRFFRYLKTPTPASLEAAFAHVFQRIFFAPAYIWLNGKFIDMSLVPDVRIDGRVIFSTKAGIVIHSPEGARTRMEKFGHLLTDEERELTKHMTPVEIESMLFHQVEKETPEGKARYQTLQTATTITWRNAQPPHRHEKEFPMPIDPAHTELARKLAELHGELDTPTMTGTPDHMSARALEDKIGSGQEATEENIARANSLLKKYGKQ